MKKNRLRSIFYIMIIVGFVACKKDANKSNEFLEVMEIHDIAMAEMGNINKQSKALRNLLKQSPIPADSVSYIRTLVQLEKAEDGMMEWMSNFVLPKDYSEAMKFLENEKTKVQKVNEDIFNALEKADEILKK